MNFLKFLSENWGMVTGLISFVFACGYTYSKFKTIEQNRIEDYKEYEKALKEQKGVHDEKINALSERLAKNETKVDSVRDDTLKSTRAIELDIREIMTILKRGEV